MDNLSRLWLPGTAFILAVAFGVWVSVSGKPYNAVLFNVHKLIALGGVILTGIAMYHTLKGLASPALYIALVAVVGLSVIALFFSGAMMSAGKVRHDLMLAIHRVALIVLVLTAAAMVYRIRAGAP